MAIATPRPGADKEKKTSSQTTKNNKPTRINKRTLRAGETRRSDGTYMYRMPKSLYGDNAPPKALYATTLADLRQKESEQIRSLETNTKNGTTKCSVNAMYERWKQTKRGVKDSSMSNYQYYYEHFVLPSKLGHMWIHQVKKSDIKQFYNSLVDKKTLQLNSLTNLHGVLIQVFQFAADDRVIPINPAERAMHDLRREYALIEEQTFENSSEPLALTLREQHLLLEYMSSDPDFARWRRMIVVLLGTGMRHGELAGLQWSDVDFERRAIYIRHNLVYFQNHAENGECCYQVHAPKTKAGRRTIWMFNFVKDALQEELEWQRTTGTHCEYSVNGFSDFVFLNQWKRPLVKGGINNAIKRMLHKHNDMQMTNSGSCTDLVPIFTVHTLRRTCATRLIEAGVYPTVVQRFMGHSKLDITMSIYVACTEQLKLRELTGQKETKCTNPFADELPKNLSTSTTQQLALAYQDTNKVNESDLTQFYTEFTQNNQ